MAEINKIFPNSSIEISQVTMSTLCFIDGLSVFSDKFSLTSDRLDIYKQSNDSVNLFYNYNSSHIYEYKLILTNSGVIVSGQDLRGDTLTNITSDNIMIFVNGILLRKDQYLVLNSSEVALLYNIPQLTFQNVLIYVSNKNINYKRLIYTANEWLLNLDNNNDNSIVYIDAENDGIISQVNYYLNSSIIFINGKKLDNIYIEVQDKAFKINKDIKENDFIEYYDLNSETESLNFYSTFGYTTFNYKDSNQKKIPLIYNAIITFNDIVKYVIDNIRTGFFIKENLNGGGVAIIVDDTFESPKVKCYIESGSIFQSGSYYPGKYYVEAPNVRSIVNYLSDYDRKYNFIPEILEVFQQTLLKEVYDSANRIKDIRNISRVDSYHINKLLKLLGVDVDIKHLPLKKRHELLEELDNWYRIVGTKDSYNIFNILQDDIKIISMEQLFTPSITYSETTGSDLVSYDYSVSGGRGYTIGNRVYFTIPDGDSTEIFSFTVTGVDENGAITNVEPDRYEGPQYEALEQVHNLSNQDLNLDVKITTISNDYKYNWSITNSSGYQVGQILHSADNKYKLRITELGNNQSISKWDIISGPTSGNTSYSETDIPLYITSASNITLNVKSTEISRSPIILSTALGSQQSIVLQPGTYYYEMSGGGGSGAAADSGEGVHGDLPAEEGQNAEYLSGTFYVPITSTLNYWIGDGGKGGYTSLREWWKYTLLPSIPGVGYLSGEQGGTVYYSMAKWSTYQAVASAGSGGGSSRIYAQNIIDKQARGGRGGNFSGWDYKKGAINVSGGLGGGMGTTGSGATGGHSTYPGRGGWAGSGSTGYIKLWKLENNYETTISGTQENVYVGQKFRDNNNTFTVTVTAVSGNTITDYDLTPANGSLTYNQSFNLNLINANETAKLNVNSQLIKSYYSLSEIEGLSQYLFEGAQLIGTIDGFTITGKVTYKNSVSNKVVISWTLPDNINIEDFNNTIIPVKVVSGDDSQDQAQIMTTFIVLVSKDEEREYVDFYTKQELGAVSDIKYVIDYEDYGTINQGTPNSPSIQVPGSPDIEYGHILDNAENINYGKITDVIKGEWVKTWIWDRDPLYYPTNHVDIEIKIESSDNAELILNRFINQFYNLASTVLYIHRLTSAYFFGNTTQNVSSGITSIDQAPVFMGIQTAPIVHYQSITLTSDPQRQSNADYNLK